MKTILILLLAATSMLACSRQTTDKNVVQVETSDIPTKEEQI